MTPGSGIRLGRIFGIAIYLHPSWFLIFALITLSLRTQFTAQHPSWSPAQHWMLGVITSLLFFGSVMFHELSHSLVAKHYKIPVASITLFVFGGLARIGREPSSASQEFNIAIAGPCGECDARPPRRGRGASVRSGRGGQARRGAEAPGPRSRAHRLACGRRVRAGRALGGRGGRAASGMSEPDRDYTAAELLP